MLVAPPAPTDEITRILVASQTFEIKFSTFCYLFHLQIRFFHDLVYDRALGCLEDALDKWSSLWLVTPSFVNTIRLSSILAKAMNLQQKFHCIFIVHVEKLKRALVKMMKH